MGLLLHRWTGDSAHFDPRMWGAVSRTVSREWWPELATGPAMETMLNALVLAALLLAMVVSGKV